MEGAMWARQAVAPARLLAVVIAPERGARRAPNRDVCVGAVGWAEPNERKARGAAREQKQKSAQAAAHLLYSAASALPP